MVLIPLLCTLPVYFQISNHKWIRYLTIFFGFHNIPGGDGPSEGPGKPNHKKSTSWGLNTNPHPNRNSCHGRFTTASYFVYSTVARDKLNFLSLPLTCVGSLAYYARVLLVVARWEPNKDGNCERTEAEWLLLGLGCSLRLGLGLTLNLTMARLHKTLTPGARR